MLLTAWLQAQNVTDAHREEIVALASDLPGALLDAVEYSDTDVHESARHWAVQALRAIPRTDDAALRVIVERTRCWVGDRFTVTLILGEIGAMSKENGGQMYS